MEELKKLLATPRGRVLAIVVVVVLAVGGFVAMTSLSPGSGSGAVAPHTVHRLHPVAASSTSTSSHASTTSTATKTTPSTSTTSTTGTRTTSAAPTPAIAADIPPALGAKLIESEVVVVQVYNPGSASEPVIDDAEAHAEALAGAKAAGVGFAAIDVNDQAQMQLLSGINGLTVNSDPYLFIVDRAGKILFQRNGYLDRDTVAQAATNALIGEKAQDTTPIGPRDGIGGPSDGYWEATADKVVCESNDAVHALPQAAATVPAAKALLAAEVRVSKMTLQGLRAVPAIGPRKAQFDALIAAYARLEADQAKALAALSGKHPSLRGLNAANALLETDATALATASQQAGIACFDTKSGAVK